MTIEFLELLVGKARIGLAHGQQLGAAGPVGIGLAVPAAKCIVGIEAGPFATPALGIHQHAVDQQRVTFPLVPQACLAPWDIGTVAPLEHQAFDRVVACALADLGEVCKSVGLDHCGQIEMRVRQARHQLFERRAPLSPWKRAQVRAAERQDIVEPCEGGIFGQHFCADVFATESLLQGIEAGRTARFTTLMRAPDQQFAIEHGWKVECGNQFGKGRGNIVARARIEPRFPSGMDQLHANAVPFPLGDVILEVDDSIVQRMREHEGLEQRHIGGVGRLRTISGPGEQLGEGRGECVPIFLHLIDRHAERLCKSQLGKPRRNAHAHPAGRHLDQRIPASRIEPVEQLGQLAHHRDAGHTGECFDRLGDARGRFCTIRVGGLRP